MTYNPSDVGKKGSIFGLPYTIEDSQLLLLPVHLDVTVSYGDGTSQAPDLMLDESSQLDLSLLSIREPWKLKMAMSDRLISQRENDKMRAFAASIINDLESAQVPDQEHIEAINSFCKSIINKVYEETQRYLKLGKFVGLIGGDHSSPLGYIRALAKEVAFGILQIDAHMDLRKAYEGFTYSHASIMYNALQEKGVSSVTQVGIRDFCEEEVSYARVSSKPIHVFYDEEIYKKSQAGISWQSQVREIIETLPQQVYVSFDVDGLIPSLCPNTGTPVPGGLDFNQTTYLLEEVVRSGRIIVGFDLCECGKASWDANVASRILYRIATLMGVSQGLLRFS